MSKDWRLGSDQPTAPSWWSSDEWSTPQGLINELEAEFGKFTLDPCCRPEVAKAPKFYTKADDGLAHPWSGRVFVNPPYSQPKLWTHKAAREADGGAFIVMLLPAAVDTDWFHRYVWRRAELRFIRGRVRFIGWQGTPIPAPRNPSLLAIFGSPLPTPETLG